MSRTFFGQLGAGNRKDLPLCITDQIHDAYPKRECQEYIGFKEKADV